MVAHNAKRPRPNKNSDGQDKKPTMSHDIHISPGDKPEPPMPPGAPAPGATNPLTHPAAPAMQSSMGTPPAGPTGKPADTRQVQERIQFKDLPAPAQNQVQQQQGIDPYAPIHQAQQAVDAGLQAGGTSGPVPASLNGPYLPPDVASFPDDFAHLQMLMGQGFAPGSSNQEHEYGMNAHALAAAKIEQAMKEGQEGAGEPTAAPYAAPPMAPPSATTTVPGVPPLSSSMGPAGPPPTAPGAPGGIPPEIIAALMQKHKRPMR